MIFLVCIGNIKGYEHERNLKCEVTFLEEFIYLFIFNNNNSMTRKVWQTL